jgi:hypothetical protein
MHRGDRRDSDGTGTGDVDSGRGKYGVDNSTTAVRDLFDHRGALIDRVQISDDVVANVHPMTSWSCDSNSCLVDRPMPES